MTATLIRSRAALLPKPGRHQVETVPDGAVLQEDGIVAAIGTFEALRRK